MNKKYFSGLSRNTFLLALTSFFGDVSTEMLYPILPIFLTVNLRASGSIVGLVEGVATAVQNIVQGFSGTLADKLERRKPVAIAGFLIAALSKPFIGLSTVWQTAFVARSMDRFGSGIRSAPRDALVAASADENHRGKAFGLEGIGDNLGAFLGPLLAIVLLFYFKVEIRQIFYLAIIPGLLAVLMVLFVKEKAVALKTKTKIEFNLKQFPARYWKFLGVIAIFGIGNLSSSFLILQSRAVGVPLGWTILIYALFNLVAATVSLPMGSLSDRLGRKNVLLAAFLVFLLTATGFAFAKNIFAIGGLFALYGVFQGIFRSVGKAFATDFVPQALRASGIGWYNTVVGLSGLFASIMAGQLWDNLGHPAVFLYAAACAFVGSLSLLALQSGEPV